MTSSSLQDQYSPDGICFGCGPANPRGLRIKSFPEGDGLVCRFEPEAWQEAFQGIVSGGIIGTILDCHSNWTAAWALRGSDEGVAPTVTAEMMVRMLAPTPAREGALLLRARAVEVVRRRASVEATLEVGGKTCATFQGVFVAVKEGHPAFQRWGKPAAE